MTTARHLARIGAVGAVLLIVSTLLHPVALSLRQIEIGLAGLSSILSGLTLVAPVFSVARACWWRKPRRRPRASRARRWR